MAAARADLPMEEANPLRGAVLRDLKFTSLKTGYRSAGTVNGRDIQHDGTHILTEPVRLRMLCVTAGQRRRFLCSAHQHSEQPRPEPLGDMP